MPWRALPARKPQKDTRESAGRRGYDRRWRKARLLYLVRHPLCVICRDAGYVTAASVVDHIQRHRGQSDPLFWNQTNWQSLCKRCHDRKTATEVTG